MFIKHTQTQVQCTNYTQFWFISNTANFEPVSDFRLSMVVACERCLDLTGFD